MKKDSRNKDIVFGIHPVLETLHAGKEIDRVFLQRPDLAQHRDISALAKERGIPVSKVPIEKLNKITFKNHQGVIAFLAAVEFASLDHIIVSTYQQGKDPFFLLLDQVTDVRNFGAIARTAEGAGLDAIVIPAKGSAQIGSDAMKTSAGALNYIPVCKEKNLLQAVKFLQENGINVIAITEKAEKNLYQTQLQGPIALIMGSEEKGISNDLIKMANELSSIPMYGKIASLNVSVAAAIALYESVRQRRNS